MRIGIGNGSADRHLPLVPNSMHLHALEVDLVVAKPSANRGLSSPARIARMVGRVKPERPNGAVDDTMRMVAAMLDGAHVASPDDLPDVVAAAAAALGWQATMYLVTYDQRTLVAFTRQPEASRPSEPVDASVAGMAFRDSRTLPAVHGGVTRIWAPLLDSVERLGVLEITSEDDISAPEWSDRVRWFAHLTGHLVAAKSPYGDRLHCLRLNDQERTVASELVWSLLPPLTMACPNLVISAALEPCDEVAGDVFDYAVAGHLAHVAIVDATGHDLNSGVIGAVTLAAYRNSRRTAKDLPGSMRHVDQTLQKLGEHTYATGIFGTLDLNTGLLRYLNAGHPAPLLLRNRKVVRELEGGRRILLGFDNGVPGTPAEEQLEPGDWIILYTDGITEARDAERAFFGLDRLIDFVEQCAADGQSAPETLRRLAHAILDHQHGILQDDATLIILQWASGKEHELSASS